MQDYTKLIVWKRAHELALSVYRVTREFPREELYALTSQIRRAAVSIPSNIAEGAGRQGRAEFAQFLSIALGSANEVDYQLLLARDLGYVDNERFQEVADLVGETKKMLASLIGKMK